MTQACVFVLILAATTNSQNRRISEKLSGECAEGPGWSSSGSTAAAAAAAADAGDQPRYTFDNRDLTLDLDRHLLSWTHLVQRSLQLTYFHSHQTPHFPGRNVYKG